MPNSLKSFLHGGSKFSREFCMSRAAGSSLRVVTLVSCKILDLFVSEHAAAVNSFTNARGLGLCLDKCVVATQLKPHSYLPRLHHDWWLSIPSWDCSEMPGYLVRPFTHQQHLYWWKNTQGSSSFLLTWKTGQAAQSTLLKESCWELCNSSSHVWFRVMDSQ